MEKNRVLPVSHALVFLLIHLGTGLAAPVLSLMLLARGATLATLPLVVGVTTVVTCLLEVPSGIAADVLGRRRVFALSMALQVATYVVLLATPSLAVVALSGVLRGLALAARTGTLEAVELDRVVTGHAEASGRLAALDALNGRLALLESAGVGAGASLSSSAARSSRPSLSMRSRTACKIYACTLCFASAAAVRIACPLCFNGLICMGSHFALYLSLLRRFASVTGIISIPFARVLYIINLPASTRNRAICTKHAFMFCAKQRKHAFVLDNLHECVLQCSHSKRHGRQPKASWPTAPGKRVRGEPLQPTGKGRRDKAASNRTPWQGRTGSSGPAPPPRQPPGESKTINRKAKRGENTMTRLTDGKRTAEIRMTVWSDQNSSYSPDWEYDFFEFAPSEYDEEADAYRVQDVDYCIDQAADCINRTGDFAADDEPVPGSTLIVDGEIVASIPTR